MQTNKTFYGLGKLSLLFLAIALIALGCFIAANAAQRGIRQPQLIAVSGQAVYDEEGNITEFPLTLRFKITEVASGESKPKTYVQTVEIDLVKQEKMTMALDGNTVEFATVREDIIEVAGALYRSQNPLPLPTMQRKAIRGEKRN